MSREQRLAVALEHTLDRLTAWRDTSYHLMVSLKDSEAIPHRNMVDNLDVLIKEAKEALAS